MPTTVQIAGVALALLALCGLGVGLGVGLTRNKDKDAPTASTGEVATSQSATADDSRTRQFTGGSVFEESGDSVVAAPPTSVAPTLAAPPSRAFGPDFVPPTPALAPEPILAVIPTPVPAVVAPAPAPVVAAAPGPVRSTIIPYVPDPSAAPTAATPAVAKPVAPVVVAAAPATMTAAAPAGPVADTSGIAPGPDGKYEVCPGMWETRDYPDKPCGVTVAPDGTVTLGEFMGGFDGFFDVDPADGHENCFNGAVAQMFQQEFCEQITTPEGLLSCQMPPTGSCVCWSKDEESVPIEIGVWPGNQGIIKFLTDVRTEAGPTDFDYPQDEAVADGGGRANNVALVTAVFQSKLSIAANCPA